MSGTSVRSFRHLEHQNPSIISEDIGRNRRLQKKWGVGVGGTGVGAGGVGAGGGNLINIEEDLVNLIKWKVL